MLERKEASEQASTAFAVMAQHIGELLVQTFGAAWADDPGPVSADPAEMDRYRQEYVIPLTNAALLAAMRLLWITATPGSTREMMLGHIAANAELLFVPELMGDWPAGDFWIETAKEADDVG